MFGVMLASIGRVLPGLELLGLLSVSSDLAETLSADEVCGRLRGYRAEALEDLKGASGRSPRVLPEGTWGPAERARRGSSGPEFGFPTGFAGSPRGRLTEALQAGMQRTCESWTFRLSLRYSFQTYSNVSGPPWIEDRRRET